MVLHLGEEIIDFDADCRTHGHDLLNCCLHLIIIELGTSPMKEIEGFIHYLDLGQPLHHCSSKSAMALLNPASRHVTLIPKLSLNRQDDTSAQNGDGQDTPNGKCGAINFGETSKNMYCHDSVGTGSHSELYNKNSHKSFMKNHQDLKHEGEPEKFKCVVLQKFRDPLTSP